MFFAPTKRIILYSPFGKNKISILWCYLKRKKNGLKCVAKPLPTISMFHNRNKAKSTLCLMIWQNSPTDAPTKANSNRNCSNRQSTPPTTICLPALPNMRRCRADRPQAPWHRVWCRAQFRAWWSRRLAVVWLAGLWICSHRGSLIGGCIASTTFRA